MAADDKTEKPTGKRIQDARKRGQMARSRDLSVAAASIAVTIALGRLGGRVMSGLGERLSRDLTHFGDHPLQAVTAGDLTAMAIDGGMLIAVLVGPLALTAMIAGVALQFAQGGINFATEALTIDFNRLNPATGFSRLAPMQAGMETLKSMFSVTAITVIAWLIIDAMMLEGLKLPWMAPADAALAGWDYTEALLWRTAWALAALATGDYFLQKYRLTKSLMMTKQEVKQEHKDQDGNPEIKGRIRQLQRQMLKKRMLNDVKKATVIITNPTHFAIALEYRRGEMAAPKVLAKGADHIAFQIRERAREHGIPMVENRPLAQALYKTAEIGETIPAPLFSAVAEVLAQLIRLKQLVM